MDSDTIDVRSPLCESRSAVRAELLDSGRHPRLLSAVRVVRPDETPRFRAAQPVERGASGGDRRYHDGLRNGHEFEEAGEMLPDTARSQQHDHRFTRKTTRISPPARTPKDRVRKQYAFRCSTTETRSAESAPSRVVNPEHIRALSVKSAVKQFLVVAICRSPPPIVIQRDHNSMTTDSRGKRHG